MALPQDRYVKIISSNVGTPDVGERELGGLIFTQGKGWIYKTDRNGRYSTTGTIQPMEYDKLVVCHSIDQVGKYFDVNSAEYAQAQRYFSYISPSATAAESLSFARVRVIKSDDEGKADAKDLIYKATGDKTVTPVCSWAETTDTSEESSDEETSPISVNDATFLAKVRNVTGEHKFVYENGVWRKENRRVDLTNFGITLADGELENLISGDTITITVSLAYAWFDENDAEVTEAKITIEAPASALSRVNENTNNFGAFTFVDKDYTCKQVKAVATNNEGYNYKYLFCVGAFADGSQKAGDNVLLSDVTAESLADYIGAANGTCLTECYSIASEVMPMAIFGATDYGMQDSATFYMFKQFSGETPTVSDELRADELDDLNVNYYGLVQVNGQYKSFYQRGKNLDGENTAVYCNEVWLKSRISTELMNMFLSFERIPANDDGEAMVLTAINGVANEGVVNGCIEIGKKLSEAQKRKVYQLTKSNDAWFTVQQQGFVTSVRIEQNGTEYIAKYRLIYSKGDAICKVEGSDILL